MSRYQHLPTNVNSEVEPDGDEENQSSQWKDQHFKATISLLLFTPLLILIGAWIGANLNSRQYQYNSSSPWEDCGGSPEVARQRGCHFDPVTFSWELDDCHDEKLIEEFLQLQDWKYYTESEGILYETIDVVQLGEANFWVTWDYHFQHCIYTWKKMHRAILNQKSINDNLAIYNHTAHCGEVFLEADQILEEVNTPANVKYPTCIPVVTLQYSSL